MFDSKLMRDIAAHYGRLCHQVDGGKWEWSKFNKIPPIYCDIKPYQEWEPMPDFAGDPSYALVKLGEIDGTRKIEIDGLHLVRVILFPYSESRLIRKQVVKFENPLQIPEAISEAAWRVVLAYHTEK